VFLGATAVQIVVIVGLDVLLGGGIGAVPPIGALARQALGNAVIGVALFQIIELLPGAVERRRLARSRLRVGRLRE